jgi:hypothetical protein
MYFRSNNEIAADGRNDTTWPVEAPQSLAA